jgi:hypothetical protein
MAWKLNKKDLWNFLNLKPTDSVADTSGSQLRKRKRLTKVPTEPLPHIQACVTKSEMKDDGVQSSPEIDKMHSDKLRKEKLFEAAPLNQLQALTLMKELEQDLISDGMHIVRNQQL